MGIRSDSRIILRRGRNTAPPTELIDAIQKPSFPDIEFDLGDFPHVDFDSSFGRISRGESLGMAIPLVPAQRAALLKATKQLRSYLGKTTESVNTSLGLKPENLPLQQSAMVRFPGMGIGYGHFISYHRRDRLSFALETKHFHVLQLEFDQTSGEAHLTWGDDQATGGGLYATDIQEFAKFISTALRDSKSIKRN
jgi:hypothetical protein